MSVDYPQNKKIIFLWEMAMELWSVFSPHKPIQSEYNTLTHFNHDITAFIYSI